MKQLSTLTLLSLFALTSCQKTTYTYFAQSTAPRIERKKVVAKPITATTTIPLIPKKELLASTIPVLSGVPSLITSTPANAVTSAEAFTRQQTKAGFRQRLLTKMVTKKVQKLQILAKRTADSRRTEPISVVSVIAGLLALVDVLLIGNGLLFLLGTIVAIVFGFVGLSKINRHSSEYKGRGFAITGLSLGFFGLLLIIIALIALSSLSFS
ncbi:DUF4190 domain-containing protein [Siphonobacter curvatus]|uniref:DUF4190 domain-containing protein n=1 Tax=Siphonobacter curvatus TaxID=2094562 RepID=A0A2S7IS49_9BACT|nr:DUF4190 domain-containing protein [Siphonobacter curvatus]PQA60543.1 hypothetical protein C5O19_13270 [Siphonobacter curvatus]